MAWQCQEWIWVEAAVDEDNGELNIMEYVEGEWLVCDLKIIGGKTMACLTRIYWDDFYDPNRYRLHNLMWDTYGVPHSYNGGE